MNYDDGPLVSRSSLVLSQKDYKKTKRLKVFKEKLKNENETY